jgi:hypothetical protein
VREPEKERKTKNKKRFPDENKNNWLNSED